MEDGKIGLVAGRPGLPGRRLPRPLLRGRGDALPPQFLVARTLDVEFPDGRNSTDARNGSTSDRSVGMALSTSHPVPH
jgi:hypothetical protein